MLPFTSRTVATPFWLAPTSHTVALLQARNISDRIAHRDGLDIGYLTDDFEVHGHVPDLSYKFILASDANLSKQ
jgi:hypothetical protein